MMRTSLLSVIVLLIPSSGLTFLNQRPSQLWWGLQNEDGVGCVDESETSPSTSSRRDFFGTVTSSAVLGSMMTTTTLFPEISHAESSSSSSNPKVLVLGGTGFVGSRVVKKLKDLGLNVIATSRNGRDGTVALDVTTTTNVENEIANLSKGCTAVISCIGAIGTPDDASINSSTGLAAAGAKAAGVQQFVYISVAPEVKEFAKNINFLKGYISGKTFSQDSVASIFSGSSTLIEPTFIYNGGDEFHANHPPRPVAGFYGEFVEALLSSGPIRAATNITPDGFVKMALEPPVSVESVANAAVAGALGNTQAVLDTHDKIKEAGFLV